MVHRALAWSVQRGRSKLVSRLLRHPGVDVNVKVRGDTMLFLACKALDRDSIFALIEAGADPSILSENASDEFAGIGHFRMRKLDDHAERSRGNTVLHALCGSRQRRYTQAERLDASVTQELFDIILEKGVSIETCDVMGRTALHTAIHSPVLTGLLLKAGADANAVDDRGHTPLHGATSPETIALLVEVGHANVDMVVNSDGRTPLLAMMHSNHKEATLKLLSYRPDLSLRDRDGTGPLHSALNSHSADILVIKALLDAGADLNERNRVGDTPILAIKMDSRGSMAIMDLLLSLGADINARDRLGRTILSRTVCQRQSGKADYANVQNLLDRGANLYVCDYKGRTLLNEAVATNSLFAQGQSPSKLDYLISLGLDAQCEDHRGNSLIHELSLGLIKSGVHQQSDHLAVFEHLLELGVNINKINHQGRTALHILSAPRCLRRGQSRVSFKTSAIGPLDYVITKSKNIDQVDVDGLSALHLACTVSASISKKLLDAGADPYRKTNDGLSPLHLAARSRQSNTIGLLLSHRNTKSSGGVNDTDAEGRTPMYYACRSGVPETVRLLLDAGADAKNKALWLACAEFEDEQRLWNQDRHCTDVENNGGAGGLTINDQTRPGSLMNQTERQYDSFRDTTRLDDIVEMLSASGCDVTGIVGGRMYSPSKWAVSDDLSSGYEHALACLARVRNNTNEVKRQMSSSSIFLERVVELQQKAVKTAATEIGIEDQNGTNGWLPSYLLNNRQYNVLQSLFDRGMSFLEDDTSHLDVLVRHGYDALLDQIGSLEVQQRHLEGRWHAFGDRSKPGLYDGLEIDPDAKSPLRRKENFFLLNAIRREAPNMDVVRLLVAKFNVDVNEYCYGPTYRGNARTGMERLHTALHEVAKGQHWWQVALCIPYLISKDANVNAKDQKGRTPLHIALGGLSGSNGPFHKEAVRNLLAGGADPNEQDTAGISCLASAAGDVDTIRLLLEYKAKISADALFMALHARRVDSLTVLLEAGANPNGRVGVTPSVYPVKIGSPERDVPSSEEYPLYYAATTWSSYCKQTKVERLARWRTAEVLMQTLLTAGADPFATFRRWRRTETEVIDETSGEDHCFRELLQNNRVMKDSLEEVVLAHDVFEEDQMIHPILTLKTLDANHRDAQGRTLLHMACHHQDLYAPIDSLLAVIELEHVSSMPTFLESMLSHGADPMATDTSGNNIVHHMFLSNKQRNFGTQDSATITRLATSYPMLLDQANHWGRTPLHMALKHAVLHNTTEAVEAILDAGVSPLTVDDDGNGYLHVLAFAVYGSAEVRSIFARLLREGVDINTRNRRGETPIFNLNRVLPQSAVTSKGQIRATEALEIFVNAGADLFARDYNGSTLLHVAAKEMQEPVQPTRLTRIDTRMLEPSINRFKLLLSKGLDPMVEDGQKRTALDVAAACGKASVLKLFENDDTIIMPTKHAGEDSE